MYQHPSGIGVVDVIEESVNVKEMIIRVNIDAHPRHTTAAVDVTNARARVPTHHVIINSHTLYYCRSLRLGVSSFRSDFAIISRTNQLPPPLHSNANRFERYNYYYYYYDMQLQIQYDKEF